jgi:hypothetical protein
MLGALLQNSTTARVKAVEVTGGPFAGTVTGGDHWYPLVGVERADAAKLESQRVQSAERGAAEPPGIGTSEKL